MHTKLVFVVIFLEFLMVQGMEIENPEDNQHIQYRQFNKLKNINQSKWHGRITNITQECDHKLYQEIISSYQVEVDADFLAAHGYIIWNRTQNQTYLPYKEMRNLIWAYKKHLDRLNTEIEVLQKFKKDINLYANNPYIAPVITIELMMRGIYPWIFPRQLDYILNESLPNQIHHSKQVLIHLQKCRTTAESKIQAQLYNQMLAYCVNQYPFLQGKTSAKILKKIINTMYPPLFNVEGD